MDCYNLSKYLVPTVNLLHLNFTICIVMYSGLPSKVTLYPHWTLTYLYTPAL